MLFDPKWKQKTKDPMSLDSLIAWLEMQPKDWTYTYQSPYNCMICKYLTAQGHTSVYVDDRTYTVGGICGPVKALPAGWDMVAKGPDWRGVHTFGQALERARELQAA